MVEMQACQPVLGMDHIGDFFQFVGTFRKMDAQLFGMLFALRRDRYGLDDQQSRAIGGDLPVKGQVLIGHIAFGCAVGRFNRWKDKPVGQRQRPQRCCFKQSLHGPSPLWL
jgi:hypothetical protein